jgi:hypothetical protein
MKIKFNKLFLLIPLSFLTLTCKKGHRTDCIKNAGVETIEIRDIQPFNAIEVGQKFELELIWDTTVKPFVEITYYDKLIHGISTDVVDGVLNLKDNNVCNWVRKQAKYPKVKLTHGDFKHLNIFGSAKVFSKKPLEVTELVVSHDGLEDAFFELNNGYSVFNSYNTGSYKLSGYARVLAVTVDDIGKFDARDLKTEDIYLFHYSLNDAHINPGRVLHAKLYNNSNVYYYSEPSEELSVETFGSGQLIKK